MDATHPGKEIIVGGTRGVVELIQFDTKKHQTIFDKGGSLHGLSVGELNADYPSQEVVAVDGDRQLFALFKEKDWKYTLVLKDSARLRDTIIGDFDRIHPGLEALVVGSSAKVIQLSAENGKWTTKVISQLPEPLARIAAGELFEKFQGPEVVLAGDKGGVYLLKQNKGIWESEEIYRDSDGLRGVAVADVQPNQPGNEVIIYGYSKNVIMISLKNDKWRTKTLWTDSDRAHSLSCGNFSPSTSWQECVVGGYSKKVTGIFYEK